MRVIAGTLRSRLLSAPRGQGTRPTSDRLRETLFSILAPRLPGSYFADLYAGTGAVGIEAISRGAEHVWFAEKAAPALAALRTNLRTLGVTACTLEDRGTAVLLERLARSGNLPRPLDIIFLDPPYEATREYESTLELLGGVRGQSLLAPTAIVVAEHASKNTLPEEVGALHQTRTRTQGDATLTFYQLGDDLS